MLASEAYHKANQCDRVAQIGNLKRILQDIKDTSCSGRFCLGVNDLHQVLRIVLRNLGYRVTNKNSFFVYNPGYVIDWSNPKQAKWANYDYDRVLAETEKMLKLPNKGFVYTLYAYMKSQPFFSERRRS